MSTDTTTYTVRPRGCASWEDQIPTFRAAQRSRNEALDRGLSDVCIVRDRDGAIWDRIDECWLMAADQTQMDEDAEFLFGGGA